MTAPETLSAEEYAARKRDLIDDVISYESGEMGAAEAVEFLGALFRAGFIPSLQGTYGRAVEALIRDGILSPEGEVLVHVEDA